MMMGKTRSRVCRWCKLWKSIDLTISFLVMIIRVDCCLPFRWVLNCLSFSILVSWQMRALKRGWINYRFSFSSIIYHLYFFICFILQLWRFLINWWVFLNKNSNIILFLSLTLIRVKSRYIIIALLSFGFHILASVKSIDTTLVTSFCFGFFQI